MAQQERRRPRSPGRVTAAALLVLFAFSAACSDREAASAPPSTSAGTAGSPTTPVDALRAVQSAIDRAGGYSLRIEQSNFVLPHWGGADGGTVQVGASGRVARAELARTGEPRATYTITLVNSQTYFKRSTCDRSFRVPGGGADVLSPYVLMNSELVRRASEVGIDGGAITARLEGVGRVRIEVDSEGRPANITRIDPGPVLRWTFTDWGKGPDVSAPGGPIEDRGPGGIPC